MSAPIFSRFLAAVLIVCSGLWRLTSAHSHINYLIINGELFPGFNPKITTNPANTIGWFTTAADDGFVPPSNYSTADIICHRDGAPPKAHAPVKAGDKIHLQWNGWPKSHQGPVMSYLASCAGQLSGCATVNKNNLTFFKIDNSAPTFLNESGGPPGYWATDVLIASNNSWLIEIPPGIEPGPYVLRHEIIALHYAARPDGAQNYPQCFNLWVTGNDTAHAPAITEGVGEGQGTKPTSFYKAADPGISINISSSLITYQIPGPTVVSGAVPVPIKSQTMSLSRTTGIPVLVTGSSTVPFPAATS